MPPVCDWWFLTYPMIIGIKMAGKIKKREIEIESEGVLRESGQIDGKCNISYVVGGIDYALGKMAYERGGYRSGDVVKYRIIIEPKK